MGGGGGGGGGVDKRLSQVVLNTCVFFWRRVSR